MERTDLLIKNKEDEIELIDFKARDVTGIDLLEVEFQLKMYDYALKDKYHIDKLCAYTFKDKAKTYFETDEKDLEELDSKLENICEKIINEEFDPKENEFCPQCIFNFCCR